MTNIEKYLKYYHSTVECYSMSVCTLFLLVNGGITCPVAEARLGNILNTSCLSHPHLIHQHIPMTLFQKHSPDSHASQCFHHHSSPPAPPSPHLILEPLALLPASSCPLFSSFHRASKHGKPSAPFVQNSLASDSPQMKPKVLPAASPGPGSQGHPLLHPRLHTSPGPPASTPAGSLLPHCRDACPRRCLGHTLLIGISAQGGRPGPLN